MNAAKRAEIRNWLTKARHDPGSAEVKQGEVVGVIGREPEIRGLDIHIAACRRMLALSDEMF